MVGQGLLVLQINQSGYAATVRANDSIFRSAPLPTLRLSRQLSLRNKIAEMDLVPDLGHDIGSLVWFRGLATLTILCAISISLMPDFGPVYGTQAPMPAPAELEELRSQMIAPLAYGADTGRRMGANDSVIALKGNPERPSIELNAILGQGDSFGRLLQRAGVGSGDADRAMALINSATAIGDIEAGTPIKIILGRRVDKNTARSLDLLEFRARFDLHLSLQRVGGSLQMQRKSIAIDDTPLRIRGVVGQSLYRSARAAGAPAEAIQNYLRIISDRTSLSAINPSDEYDIIISHRRAETGETESGELLYAGLGRGGVPRIQMLKWSDGDSSQWYEASGVGESRGQMGRPVNGPVTSNFGMRSHPILGYRRMHSGMDFKAGHGAPIYAATDGIASFVGRKGGYGNFVELKHAGGLGTGYAHMSRFAVSYGQRVRQGQIIGYVGSTGLSTGPHLHYELYRNGVPINPASVTFTQRAQLDGPNLQRFRALLARLKSVKPGAALSQSGAVTSQQVKP